MEEGKQIYAQCSLAYLHLHNFEEKIKGKVTKLQSLADNLLQPDQKLENFEHAIEIIHDNIRGIEAEKEKALKRFSFLRDHLSPQITLLQNQLKECLAAKASYEKFVVIDLNVAQLALYALCALISVSDALKDSWKKHLAQLKTNYNDFFSRL